MFMLKGGCGGYVRGLLQWTADTRPGKKGAQARRLCPFGKGGVKPTQAGRGRNAFFNSPQVPDKVAGKRSF
ncbi:hypothetical protein BGE01nite_43210 [Brevifollis gellanilyticus]|uniref:Uncharacterized protein n=1 Tax=Brevifollis gellanilyticus TaxID=748831 RepID=A0A512ME71_9BACT|nr:hypothetical protein BGE01nite_43210 [Brevifollis gellanilyticus]